MVPIRRQLIVKEHGNLAFPEGQACADVLVPESAADRLPGACFWDWDWAGFTLS